MPELPEVETVRRQLEKEVVGRTIKGAVVRYGGRLNVKPAAFVAAVKGTKIVSAGRRAKLLMIGLSNGNTLVTHLKMTGHYLLVPSGTTPGKHVHLVFSLSGGQDLHFEDVRKFGYVRLYRTDEVQRLIDEKEGYGPEPLDPSFTAEKFSMCVRGRAKKRIKPLLMEQTCIAGIGNIYADESLWRARVRPQRRVQTLSSEELRRLHAGIRSSLTESLKRQGTSADNFVDLYGSRGKNVPNLAVYGRGGKACKRCGGTIKKITFAGRGTHFCPKCQK